MFTWFKNLFKKNEPLPLVEVPDPVVPRVKAQDSSPQVKDYPRSQYNAYWEIFHTTTNNRHAAEVRFCGFNGKVLSKSELTAGSKTALVDKVNALITSKMENYKR